MKVQVLYSLPAVLAAVVDDTVTVRQSLLRGNFLCRREDVCDNLRVFLRQRVGRGDVHFRDHQDVHGRRL